MSYILITVGRERVVWQRHCRSQGKYSIKDVKKDEDDEASEGEDNWTTATLSMIGSGSVSIKDDEESENDEDDQDDEEGQDDEDHRTTFTLVMGSSGCCKHDMLGDVSGGGRVNYKLAKWRCHL